MRVWLAHRTEGDFTHLRVTKICILYSITYQDAHRYDQT